ncbi:MAG: hypothetical protein J0I24_14590 [Thiomonas arsenitoxydans]|uniref:Uncharacterized protein n=1 Tax=Thiomonas arsenitoxydans (strain DSM 22701 / CIP 110005 / 3As) TaxID=426114 RepID=A0A8I1MYR1_THIA3|nr:MULTISPECIES: hypothetical protein [Thiomonas]MBN8745510.1 hypothetical protein [Thiomonas arsenitoxydans]ODU96302.1 MAG: hypothetical protein ABT24_09560 [Thiomonas sp. SCN 64-16]
MQTNHIAHIARTQHRPAPAATTPGILARAGGLLIGLLAVAAGYPAGLIVAFTAGMFVGHVLDIQAFAED